MKNLNSEQIDAVNGGNLMIPIAPASIMDLIDRAEAIHNRTLQRLTRMKRMKFM